MHSIFSAIVLLCSLGAAFGGVGDCTYNNANNNGNVDLRNYGPAELFSLYEQNVHGGVQEGLACIGYKIITDTVPNFRLNSDKLFRFLSAIEGKYKAVPYHNALHGMDVMQTAYSLMLWPKIQGFFTDDAEKLALLIASAGHDVDHPGLNNGFLKKMNDQVPRQWELDWPYTEASPLETHHLAVVEQKLTETNLLADITEANRTRVMELIRELILSTDMAKHGAHETELRAFVDRKKLEHPFTLNKEDREFVLKMIIHLADISHPTKPRGVSMRMVGRVAEEFFLQGTKEAQKFGPNQVSGGFDRTTNENKLGSSQVGFIDGYVSKIWNAFGELVRASENDKPAFITNLESNRAYYDAHKNLELRQIYPNCCPQ